MSSGMFVYTIRHKKNLPFGTKIRNKAAIYFDYNQPIITNTTLNTIVQKAPNSIAEVQQLSAEGMLLFPNPANDQFAVVLDSKRSGGAQLNVYDISGRLISN